MIIEGDLGFKVSLCAVLSHSVVPTLCEPMDYSPSGSSAHGDSPGNTGVGCQALLQGSSQPRDRSQVSLNAGGSFTV